MLQALLVQLERDGRPYQLARAANLPVLGSSTDDLVERMRERWGGLWEERGIAPGTAGPLMLKLMAMCGDLYGSAPMTDGTAEHLARMVHAANTSFSDRVEQQVAMALDEFRLIFGASPARDGRTGRAAAELPPLFF